MNDSLARNADEDEDECPPNNKDGKTGVIPWIVVGHSCAFGIACCADVDRRNRTSGEGKNVI